MVYSSAEVKTLLREKTPLMENNGVNLFGKDFINHLTEKNKAKKQTLAAFSSTPKSPFSIALHNNNKIGGTVEGKNSSSAVVLQNGNSKMAGVQAHPSCKINLVQFMISPKAPRLNPYY